MDSGTSQWQLAAGHYQPSEFFSSLELWSPRMDADRVADGNSAAPAWAYHKRGPTAYAKRLWILPAGGSDPWWVDINDAPPGTTIENDPDSDDYLCMTIPAQSAGTYTINITINDQAGATLNKSWSYEVIDRDNTTYFVHLTAGSGGTEAGTAANPKRNLGQILGPNEDDTTWNDRQVLLSGTLNIDGQAADYDGVDIELILNANKPQVWMAVTKGAATFRGSTTNVDGSNFDIHDGIDWVFAGCNFDNPLQDIGATPPNRNRFIGGIMKYGGVFDAEFDCTTTSDDTDGNNSACLFMDAVTYDGWVSLAGNRFLNGNTEIPPIEFYSCHHVRIHKCELSNYSGFQGFFAKGGNKQDKWLFSYVWGTGNSGVFATIQAIDFDTPPYTRTEYEFLRVRWQSSFMGILAKGDTDFTFSISTKHCNFKVPNHYFQGSSAATGTCKSQYDAIEHSGTYTQGWRTDGAGVVFTLANNNHGTSGILNDTTAFQDSPDGTVGAEVL